MRRIVVLVASLALLGSGATLALATGGHHGHPNGGGHQYKPKPHCPNFSQYLGKHGGKYDDFIKWLIKYYKSCPKPPDPCKDKADYKNGYWWHHDSKPSWCKPPDKHCYHDKTSSKYKKSGKYYYWYSWDCWNKGKWYDKDKDHSHDD